MAYLDCYTEGDLDGHPTSTYLVDVNDAIVKQAATMLKRQYDRVEKVDKTEGQSALLLSAFLIANSESKPPTIQNAVEGITLEARDMDIM